MKEKSFKLRFRGKKISGVMVGDKRFVTYNPDDPALVQNLLKNKIEVVAEPRRRSPVVHDIVHIMVSHAASGRGLDILHAPECRGAVEDVAVPMSFGRSKARMINEETRPRDF